jgi:hypothetical protein
MLTSSWKDSQKPHIYFCVKIWREPKIWERKKSKIFGNFCINSDYQKHNTLSNIILKLYIRYLYLNKSIFRIKYETQ